jgi:hypothetical protein
MNECEHKWVFQETKKKTSKRYTSNGYTAYFDKIDIYYCEKCCEIKEIEKGEYVDLPFGGIHHVKDFAPSWY